MADPTPTDVQSVITAYTLAKEANKHAESIVFEPEQIEGTRYKLILTDQNN